MMRPIQADQDGRLYAISHQGLWAFVDYLGGLRLSFQRDDGSLGQSMILSSQETAGLRQVLNQDQDSEELQAPPADG